MLKPPSCLGCPLQSLGDSFSRPDGLGTSGVTIIGDALDYEGHLDGVPFNPKGQAGSKLEEVFRLAATQAGRPISRNQFKLWNVIGCKPPGEMKGASYETAIRHCKVHFDPIVGLCSNISSTSNTTAGGSYYISPNNSVLLALGDIPLTTLTGMTGLKGEKQSLDLLRGFIFQSPYGLVIPSHHPQFIKRGKNEFTPLLIHDLLKAMDIARGTYPINSNPFHSGYVPPVYQITPSIDEAWAFYYQVKDNPRLPLTFDIETPESVNIDEDERDELANADITLCQFSLSKHRGIAFPFGDMGYRKVIDSLFALPNPKANHNCYNFDNPRLRAKGVKIEGVIHDTMWMFKWWHSTLPRGLQSVASLLGFPFPWKHLYGSNLNWYGCADVDAVQWILAKLPGMMKERGVWEGYKRHILDYHIITQRGSEVGISVNPQKHEEVRQTLVKIRTEKDTELQKEIPDECRSIKPRKKLKSGEIIYGYSKIPPKVREGIRVYGELLIKLQDRYGTGSIPPVQPIYKFLYNKYHIVNVITPKFEYGDQTPDTGWCIREPFKGSSQQLIKYLKWKQAEIKSTIETTIQERQEKFEGRNVELTTRINELKELATSYTVPKDMKTRKETTGKRELEELYFKNGDPVLEKVMEIRSLDTNLNNYIPNWKPHSDGAVHTTFGFSAPTGQTDSRRPNILNMSKHTKYGQIFRRMIEAPPGYVFIEADKKSFHVATMGYVANDATYIKFSQTDPHSILGSYIDPSVIGGSISLKWSTEDILLAAKEFKKRCKQAREKDPIHGVDIRQQIAKPTVLGNQLGLGAKKLHRQNRRYILSVPEAERLQRIQGELFPKVELAKKHIKDQAWEQKYLIDEFGKIQYFWDIYTFVWDARRDKWDRKEGDGAREPIAFRVQGTAFGMIQMETLEMERKGYCERFNWVNSIHDSNIFMPRVEDKDLCIQAIKEEMRRPCKYLVNEATGPEGLMVDVEISVGRNWQNWDKEKNPEGMKEI